MQSILSDNYHVHFNEYSYRSLNAFILENTPSKIFILVDENTHDHCAPILLSNLETHCEIEMLEIESGEPHKNLDTCMGLWQTLTDLGADRKSLLINLGGGVITDMGGFIASTFKRGIWFINIPTTLLSMVDASVGGKTGVDLGVLKNQIGLFSYPEMVLIDPNYLETLPERETISGLAEIIKYGLTFDVRIWDLIKNYKTIDVQELKKLIHPSIDIKNQVVLKDPKEANLRKVLNYGHTLGHAIESYFLDAADKETITHGEAIAIGMICAAYISYKQLDFPIDQVEEIKHHILQIYDKVVIEQDDYEAILALLIHDKKNVGNEIKFVLLKDLTKWVIDCNVPTEVVVASLDYYNC